jgi:hypothetical protein
VADLPSPTPPPEDPGSAAPAPSTVRSQYDDGWSFQWPKDPTPGANVEVTVLLADKPLFTVSLAQLDDLAGQLGLLKGYRAQFGHWPGGAK